jgi:hypothetical protein
LGVEVETLTLDADGGESLAALLGERWERFAVGLDPHELGLALLPLLLRRILDGGAPGAAYIAAGADLSTATVLAPAAGIAVDPLSPRAGADEGRLNAVVVAPDAAARELLERWRGFAERVLEQEHRTLTARTTVRWIRALADVLPGISMAHAGITVPGEAAQDPVAEAYAFDALPGGLPLTLALRRLLREAGREGSFRRPLSELDANELLKWLSEPIESAHGVPRYLAALRDHRSDLRERWPQRTPDASRALLAWALEHGRAEDPVLKVILSPAAGPRGTAWLPGPPSVMAPFGVNVLGYWQAELGIGEAGRLVAVALDEARVPLQPIAVPTALATSRQEHPFVSAGANSQPFPVNLVRESRRCHRAAARGRRRAADEPADDRLLVVGDCRFVSGVVAARVRGGQ